MTRVSGNVRGVPEMKWLLLLLAVTVNHERKVFVVREPPLDWLIGVLRRQTIITRAAGVEALCVASHK